MPAKPKKHGYMGCEHYYKYNAKVNTLNTLIFSVLQRFTFSNNTCPLMFPFPIFSLI